MIHTYGGDDNLMMVGITDFGDGIPTPFIATGDRKEIEKVIGEAHTKVIAYDPQKQRDMIALFEAHGTVMRFHNPEAAERAHRLMAMTFSSAERGPWGDIGNDERTMN